VWFSRASASAHRETLAPMKPAEWSSYLARGVFVGKKMLVGGNWKCNGTTAKVSQLVAMLNDAPVPPHVEVVVCPVALHIPTAVAGLKPEIQVGAQNCSVTGTGAFTGEVAASQLKDFGIQWTITGHSERREMGETNEQVALKTKEAVSEGLSVIACVGEKIETRKAGKTLDLVLNEQMASFLSTLAPADWAKVAIAYEPVWAIGTGETATPEQAQEVHAAIRKWLAENVSPAVAADVRIMYGGSVKAANAKELAQCPDIDGFLVGGASLKPEFADIIQAF